MFPSFEVAKYLIECGANVNEINDSRATPLHVVVSNENFNAQVTTHNF